MLAVRAGAGEETVPGRDAGAGGGAAGSSRGRPGRLCAHGRDAAEDVGKAGNSKYRDGCTFRLLELDELGAEYVQVCRGMIR